MGFSTSSPGNRVHAIKRARFYALRGPELHQYWISVQHTRLSVNPLYQGCLFCFYFIRFLPTSLPSPLTNYTVASYS